MEGKGSFFILLIIVAILTLTLAILAGYLFFVSGTTQQPKTDEPQNEVAKRPLESELERKKLFTEKKYFNLKNANDDKLSVIMVNCELIYFKKVKGIKNTQEKVDLNDSKIKEIVGTYFQGLSLEEIKKLEAKQNANKELTKRINDFLISNEKQKNPIIYEVVFDEWFYQ